MQNVAKSENVSYDVSGVVTAKIQTFIFLNTNKLLGSQSLSKICSYVQITSDYHKPFNLSLLFEPLENTNPRKLGKFS